MAETFSSDHNAGAASAGAASAGAASAGPTCSRVAEQGASPFPPAAVCRWCTHLSSTQHLLNGDVTPPEDQRSPSADQGFPQRTSGTSYEPVCANPNPAVACASAPPVLATFVQPLLPLAAFMRPSPPSRGPRRLHAALAAFMRPSPPSCGPRRLHAALAAFMRPSPPSCGTPSSPPHTGLGPVVLQGPFLAAVLPRCRPLLQSSLHLREDADWGGLLWRIVQSLNIFIRNLCRIYVSLIMAPVRQFICVTEW